ncbi:MAG: adenylate/guanylate cyclase domain-containing protein [Pseudolabrys sp.]|jgi:class 3 adenylate cyclase
MIGPVETAAAFILFAILAVALYHQWRQAKRLRAQLATADAALERLQQTCSRLAPAGIVQQLIVDEIQSDIRLAAERKVATAMFVDLVGFSAMSERLDPEVLLRVINGYYQRISDALDEHRGHVGSFVGDGIVAYFGAIQPNPWECDDAVRAALAMRTAIREYNVELERDELPRIAIGIGIDRGPGLAGLVGSSERREYAFIGRTVNLAARIQALTRIHHVDILVSEALRAALAPEFILARMPPEPVKGFADPVVTYAVQGVQPVLSRQA